VLALALRDGGYRVITAQSRSRARDGECRFDVADSVLNGGNGGAAAVADTRCIPAILNQRRPGPDQSPQGRPDTIPGKAILSVGFTGPTPETARFFERLAGSGRVTEEQT